MMEKIISYILPCTINIFAVLYIQKKMLNKKIKFSDYRLYLGIILLILLNILDYTFISGFIRFLMSFIVIVLLSNFIFREKISNIFGSTVLEQIILFLSELLCAIICLIFKVNILTITENNFLNLLITNIIISTIAIILYNIKFISKLCNKIFEKLNLLDTTNKNILVLILFITLNILLMLIYSTSENKNIVIINIIFMFVYATIIHSALNEKSENIKYKEQNKMLIDNLNEYEKMLDYQRVNNHENKNQLSVIQGMIDKTNTKALEYLDEVIKEKREDDEGIYTSASIIPQGGLQGLVYQKMLKMKENNITINLKVERKVRKINLDNLPSKTNYDLCRAVGIIIDNAIEENLNLKEREILICMYILDECLVIEVSNKCSVIPDMTRLDEKGYTTKSNGHGYGLSLLKEIVDSNKNIINERSINKDIFTQIIKIKK